MLRKQFQKQQRWERSSLFSSEEGIKDWVWPFLGVVTQVYASAPQKLIKRSKHAKLCDGDSRGRAVVLQWRGCSSRSGGPVEPSENSLRPRPLEGRKTPLSKKTLLLYVFVYIQQFGAENISVENDVFVIAFRTIFEKKWRGYSPCQPNGCAVPGGQWPKEHKCYGHRSNSLLCRSTNTACQQKSSPPLPSPTTLARKIKCFYCCRCCQG